MRIVHVTKTLVSSGVSQKEALLAKAQLKLGHDVIFVTTKAGHKSWKEVLKRNEIPNAEGTRNSEKNSVANKIITLPTLFHYSDLYFCRGVASIVKNLRADIWHLHEPSHGLPVQVANIVRHKAPIVIDQHQYTRSFDNRKLVELEYEFVRKRIVNRAYFWADSIVSVTKGGIDFLKKEYKIDRGRVHLIPLGADTEFFSRNEEIRKRTRNVLDISDDHVLIITTGSLHAFKRHDVLLKAFAFSIKHEQRLRLLIVGDGEYNYANQLNDLIDELGIRPYVIQKGFVKEQELASLFNASDIATWALFPTISISQAIACGVPLLISRHPSQSHFLDFGCGIGFTPLDIQDYSTQLVHLARDNKLRDKLISHNVEFGKKNLTPQSISRRYQEVYLEAQYNCKVYHQ